MFEITYYIQEKDFLIGASVMRKYSSSLKQTQIFGTIFLTCIPIINFFIRQRFTSYYLLRLIIEIILILGVYKLMRIFLMPLSARQTVASIKRRGTNGILGEHKIVLTENFLIESTVINESHHSWTGIDRIIEDRNHIFIMLNSQQYYNIPKRAFSNTDEARQFYDQAVDYLNKAKQV